ncbi:MAG: hypothetical protein K8T26_11835 [Lentisphaerae bacterium]|nr:hypothetical protein [Lentisphaerota bacterium]
MQVLGDVGANFNTNETVGVTNVFIDCMVQAGRLPYGNDDGPEPPSAVQLAAFFNTNGLLTVRNSAYTNAFQGLTRAWTTIQHTPVGSNDWVRLTITMDYRSAGDDFYNDHYYSVVMNGTLLTSPMAYTNFPVTEADAEYPSGGAVGTSNHWFLCADSGFGSGVPNNRYFSGIEFSGAGNVDDVVVNANTPSNPPCATPYECWVEKYLPPGVRGTGDDPDGDGATNLEEYYNGTDPSNPLAVFKVMVMQRTGTVSRVEWLGSTNSGFTTTYSMYRATNMPATSFPNGWILVATNIPRSATGTNLWFDPSPPAVRSFYRPSLLTNAP